MVDIICPLVEIELNDLPESEGLGSLGAPAPQAPDSPVTYLFWRQKTVLSLDSFTLETPTKIVIQDMTLKQWEKRRLHKKSSSSTAGVRVK